MKGLRRRLRVTWTAKKTNEWVLNKAGIKTELLDTVKARKLAYYGHTMRKQGSCLEKEIMQGTMLCMQARKTTHGLDGQHQDDCGRGGDAENARPENDGQRKLWVWKMQEWKMTDKNYGVWKMQDWKMTDKLLANCEHNYGVWKMQEYKSS